MLEKLIEEYGYNNPISIQDIRNVFSNLSKVRVNQIIDELEKNNQLIRYSMGIYYIPTETIFGKSKLNVQKVIQKKYIEDKDKIFGFYTGLSFMNMIGLTTQVPNTIEISTNNESSRVRDVLVGSQVIKLRKARVEVSNENYKELQLLECLSQISNENFEGAKDVLYNFAKENKLNINNLILFSREFPARVTKNLLSMGVVYGAI